MAKLINLAFSTAKCMVCFVYSRTDLSVPEGIPGYNKDCPDSTRSIPNPPSQEGLLATTDLNRLPAGMK